MHHLDDPVVVIFPLKSETGMTHELRDLPMGKYVVCGEAMVSIGTELQKYQSSCFETIIERLDPESKFIIILEI